MNKFIFKPQNYNISRNQIIIYVMLDSSFKHCLLLTQRDLPSLNTIQTQTEVKFNHWRDFPYLTTPNHIPFWLHHSFVSCPSPILPVPSFVTVHLALQPARNVQLLFSYDDKNNSLLIFLIRTLVFFYFPHIYILFKFCPVPIFFGTSIVPTRCRETI